MSSHTDVLIRNLRNWQFLSRPGEMRTLTRQNIKLKDLEIGIGKGRTNQASKRKLIKWSPILQSTITKTLALQRITGLLVCGNTTGKLYTHSRWTTIWTRLMGYCEATHYRCQK